MIVITGVSGGLGKELAALFVSEGKQVVGLSRKPSMQGIEHIATDLRDERSIDNACKNILAMHESIEALINCAGVLSVEKIESLTVTEISDHLHSAIQLIDNLSRELAIIIRLR
jgi:NADP-dependent 3-hydroxy acid dehydrogenase YdfG